MGSVDLIQNLFYLTQMLISSIEKTHLQTCMCKQFEAILD